MLGGIVLTYELKAWRNPKLFAYIDFICFTTMEMLQLNQSNLLLTPFYVHKTQFISNKLHRSSLTWPASWTSFSFLAPRLLYFETSHYIICFTIWAIWFRLFCLMTTELVQSLNKVHMKYVLHNKQPFADVFQNRHS